MAVVCLFPLLFRHILICYNLGFQMVGKVSVLPLYYSLFPFSFVCVKLFTIFLMGEGVCIGLDELVVLGRRKVEA